MKKLRFTMLWVAALSLSVLSCKKDKDDDDNGNGGGGKHPYADKIRDNGVILTKAIKGDRTFRSDSVYYLDGYVFVESGTLTIEPGTVIMSFETPSSVAEGNETSLIVTREARIEAEGTPQDPIIFTSEFDEEPFGGPLELDETDSKLWAGLIMLGKAPAYAQGNTDAIQIEGIPDGEARAQYGGTQTNHSSGTLRYVSIRFTGAEIGPGDEIQGLTLGGVGAGTTIEYIDIFVSGDDGIEIFGGTVNINHISVGFSEDDAFDFDLGWTGYGQYLFAISGGNGFDHGGEWDGASPDNAPLYSTGRIYNATLIGGGSGVTRSADAPAILMRDGSAYSMYNSIITDWNGKAIELEDLGEAEDSYDKTILDVNGDGASISGNIWYVDNATGINDMFALTGDANSRDPQGTALAAYFTNNNNEFLDPQITGISRTRGSGGLNPIPQSAAATSNVVTSLPDMGAETTTYKGAFDPTAPLWIADWTTLARYGYLTN